MLTLKNPCIDPAYVTIESMPLVIHSYDLYDFDPTGLQWIHDPFNVNTVPISHTLCGDLTYEATFMDNPIDTVSDPMKYN